jgi:DNA-directed RNA polymerase specialized sigma24 family protein
VNEAEWVAAHLWIARSEVSRRKRALFALGVPLVDARQEAAIGLIRAYRSSAPNKGGALARIYARGAVQNLCRGHSRRDIGQRAAGIYLDEPTSKSKTLHDDDVITYKDRMMDVEDGAHPFEHAPRDRVGRCLRLVDAERVILDAGFNDEQIRLVAFVLLGMSYVEIAEAHGVSRQAVQQQAKRVEIRLTGARNDPPQGRERAA